MVNYDRRVRIWDNLGIYAQISPMRALPFKLPCSRILVPFTVRRPETELRLQPDFNFKGPLIITHIS